MTSTDPQDHYKSYFDHTYLRWFDLCGQPSLVRIVKAERKVKMTLPGGRECRKPVLHLFQIKGRIETIDGDDEWNVKPLVLNVMNGDDIAKIHGPSVSGWVGKEIVLFQTTRTLRGQPTEAIGVRAKKPEGTKARPVA